MLEMIAEALMGTLPHGSGIDCDWTYTITSGAIRLQNFYHLMSEHGYYEGYQKMTLVLPLHADIEDDWKLEFNKPVRHTNSMCGLRDCLEDVFGNWVMETARFFWADNFYPVWRRRTTLIAAL